MIAFRRRGAGAPARVLAPSARIAQTATVLAAHQDQRERAGHQLSDQIAYVQVRAAQYVVLAEGVARSAWRFETFFDLDRHRDDDVIQTPAARALGRP